MSDSQQSSEPHVPAPDAVAPPGPVASEQPVSPRSGDAPQPPAAAAPDRTYPSYGVSPQPYGDPPQQSYPGYAQPQAPGRPTAPQGYNQPPAAGHAPAQGYAVPPQQGYPPVQAYGQATQAPGYPQQQPIYVPHPGYQLPAPGQQPAVASSTAGAAPVVAGPPTNNPALWSLILGAISAASLLSLLIPFFGFFIVIMTFPLSICSVALGYAGLSKAKRSGGVGRTNAIIGMILGHIVLLLAIAVGVFLLVALVAAMGSGSFG
jgi:hypothetical protein